MKRNIPMKTSRRPHLLGPATLVALLLGAAILIVGRLSNAPDRQDRVAFQADAQGRLQRVASAPALPSSTPMLWKPEVKQLLESGASLGLTSDQTAALKRLDAQWNADKLALEQQINAAVAQAKPQRSGSVEQVVESLDEYSRLSRRYEERRAAYWSQALATLSASQYRQWNNRVQQGGRVSQR